MSTMAWIDARAHIVTDSEAARELVQRAIRDFNGDVHEFEDRKVAVREGEGFTEVELRSAGFGVDPDLGVLSETASLGNGSYGLEVWESDFGIDDYSCYGDVELVEAEPVDGALVWSSEDNLRLSVTMEPGEWQKVLGCEAGSVIDEIESRGDDLLQRLFPERLLQIFEDEQLELSYFEVDGDYDGHRYTEAVFDAEGHEVSHDALMGIADALSCVTDERPVPGVKYLLRLTNAEEDEAYESRMLDMDTYSMITFKSDWEGIRDVKVLTPRGAR